MIIFKLFSEFEKKRKKTNTYHGMAYTVWSTKKKNLLFLFPWWTSGGPYIATVLSNGLGVWYKIVTSMYSPEYLPLVSPPSFR